jgi:transcriptional regulator GlxA family with amidase domain
MRVAVLALEGVFDTGLATMLDVFATANELGVLLPTRPARLQVQIVGVRRRVRTSQGFTVPVAGALEQTRADWLLIPAIGCKMPETLVPALARADVRDAAAALRVAAAGRTRIGAACIGTFVLAESGLLEARSATTTWWLATLFRQRYPGVKLEDARMLVPAGNIVTAGAALSHVDLALWFVRQFSPELASLVARYLIVDTRPSQSAYAISEHLSHADPVVERFERWARSRLAEGFSLGEAAQAAGTSKRTLARRLDEVLGRTPLSYFQDLRVEQAVHLLQTTGASVDQIAAQVGYADGVTLRTLLRRRLGRGVRALRSGTA